MPLFFYNYPYLIFSVFAILVLSAFYYYLPRQRQPLLIGSVFASPQAFASLWLVPEYWHPEYVIELPWNFGFEDVLFNFYTGGVAWLLATCLIGNRLEMEFKPATVVRRYLYVFFFGLVIGSPLHFIGMRPIDIAFVVFGLWILVILLIRPSFYPLALSGGLFGFVFAALLYRLNIFLWSRIPQYFNWPKLWGISIGDIPLEEYVYYVLFCAAWSLTVCFMLNARVRPSGQDANIGRGV